MISQMDAAWRSIFFGTPNQKQAAEPVLQTRKLPSRAQLEAEAAKEAYESRLAELEAGTEARAAADWSSVPTRILIAQDCAESLSEYASEKDFWPAMINKHGLSKRQLSHLMAKREHYQDLSQKPLQNKSSKNRRRKRASGAGRSVPFPEVLLKVAQWLSLERSFGHTILPSDILAELLCQLTRTFAEG